MVHTYGLSVGFRSASAGSCSRWDNTSSGVSLAMCLAPEMARATATRTSRSTSTSGRLCEHKEADLGSPPRWVRYRSTKRCRSGRHRTVSTHSLHAGDHHQHDLSDHRRRDVLGAGCEGRLNGFAPQWVGLRGSAVTTTSQQHADDVQRACGC